MLKWEDGANPSRTRHCNRGQTSTKPLEDTILGRVGGRMSRKSVNLPVERRRLILRVIEAERAKEELHS